MRTMNVGEDREYLNHKDIEKKMSPEYREHDEKAQEEAERGNALRMSSSGKRVARKLGAERMCPAEYMGSGV